MTRPRWCLAFATGSGRCAMWCSALRTPGELEQHPVTAVAAPGLGLRLLRRAAGPRQRTRRAVGAGDRRGTLRLPEGDRRLATHRADGPDVGTGLLPRLALYAARRRAVAPTILTTRRGSSSGDDDAVT